MSAPGPVHTYDNVSVADWGKLSAAAEEKFGVAFTGNLGVVEKDGVQLAYRYDPATETATANILHRGMLDPSEHTLDKDLDEWVSSVIGPTVH
jgi:hypothetical protein